MTDKPRIILASQSPRRREILNQFEIAHEVIIPDCQEVCADCMFSATQLVKVNSRIKCENVAVKLKDLAENVVVIGCDTVAAYQDKIIGKPESPEDAKQILRMLSGTSHQVISGLTVIKLPEFEKFTTHDVTQIQMLPMSEDEIDEYVKSGEALGKAGAYAIQETGDRFVKIAEGSFYNVVGLPIEKLAEILTKFNINIELA